MTALDHALFTGLTNQATGDDLREQIHRHLRGHPHLTACEIARALNLYDPRGCGQTRIRQQLVLMEDDGEAERTAGPRHAACTWTAT